MQTFDSEEMPPPMPGQLPAVRIGAAHGAEEDRVPLAAIRQVARVNITARLVPPRMNTAGMASSGMSVSCDRRSGKSLDVARAGARRGRR